MAFVLVVRMRAAEGNLDEVVATLKELAAATQQEPGCAHYIPVQDPEDPRSFLLYEQYADEAAFEAHGASEHFQRLALGKLFALLESDRERRFYRTLA
jgi:quinol monooxygenase YgiN